MSVPDMRSCAREGLWSFTRFSDLEPMPALLDSSAEVWLDRVETDHCLPEVARRYREDGWMIALVSPEPHGRPRMEAWQDWMGALDFARDDGVLLCTDLPQTALEKVA